MGDFEKMELMLSILRGLMELPPDLRETWRAQCLAVVSDDAREFVNAAADLAGKEI